MTTVVVHVITPLHVVSSLSAVLTKHPNLDVLVTILVYWPGAPPAVVQQLTDAVREMVRPFRFVRQVLPIFEHQLVELLSIGHERGVARAMRREILVDRVTEIYYSHDVVGVFYQLLATGYPRARRVCFGDPLGLVFERRVHLAHLGITVDDRSDPPPHIGRRIGRALRGFARRAAGGAGSERRSPLRLNEFRPHEAALILPVDQSGNFLRNITLTVCQRPTVIKVLQACSRSCRDLQDYIDRLLDLPRETPKYLLLTESGAEGNFIALEREIEMYAEVIREHCKPGGIVFLKSHPRETLPRNEAIRERLGATHEVVELDRRFQRYPIELWERLVTEATVICMSFPVLSLKYLYDVDVVQPMDEPFIERWYPAWTWASYKNALSLYMEPLRRLAGWNGRGVLWAGGPGA